MAARRTAGDRLFATAWVHVFEEDAAGQHVYRREDDNIPLSRRPRERLELDADGSARIYVPGADDRPAGEPATWHEEDSEIVIRARGSGTELRIVDMSPSRLLVRVERAGAR